MAWHSFISRDFNSCGDHRSQPRGREHSHSYCWEEPHNIYRPEEEGDAQKLFHFLAPPVHPIEDIVPLDTLHPCPNVYGFTMKRPHILQHRAERCPSNRSASEMQLAAARRQPNPAPAWKPAEIGTFSTAPQPDKQHKTVSLPTGIRARH